MAIWLNSLKCKQDGAPPDWTPEFFNHFVFLSNDFKNSSTPLSKFKTIDFLSGNMNKRKAAYEAQLLLYKYHKQYGDPEFPSYFQSYTPNSTYIRIEELNDD